MTGTVIVPRLTAPVIVLFAAQVRAVRARRRIRGPTMTDAFICDAVRTPIGRYGGALSSVRPDDLAAIPIAALISRNPSLDPEAIDDVLLGCANQAGEDNR